MKNIDIYIEMIPKYLSGSLDNDVKAKFEKALSESEELRTILSDTENIKNGIINYKASQKDHIDSRTLSEYAVNPDDIDDKLRHEIDTHLKTCSSCKDEYLLCADKKTAENELSDKAEVGLLNKYWKMFTNPKATLRPIVQLVIAFVLTIPLSYLGITFWGSQTAIRTVQLTSVAVRDQLETIKTVIISKNESVLEFEFAVDGYIKDRFYNYHLSNEFGQLIYSQNYNKIENKTKFITPTARLKEGDYTIRVIELEDGIESIEIAIIPIKIQIE